MTSADFPAGHALRAVAFYGLAAFCVARLAPDRRQGYTAYLVALVLIGAISLTRVYLGAHFPIDVLGGWMAGAALVSVIVAVHVLGVDERLRGSGQITAPRGELQQHKVAVPLHASGRARPPSRCWSSSTPPSFPFFLDIYDAIGYVGVAIAVALETFIPIIPSEVIVPMAGWKVSQSAADPSVLEPLTHAPWSFLGVLLVATLGRWRARWRAT